MGTPLLSWRDLSVIVKHSPHGSALKRQARGVAADYGVAEYLLVSVVNSLRLLSYQLDGRKHKPEPDMFYPPGVDDPRKVGRADAMTVEEMNQLLGWT